MCLCWFSLCFVQILAEFRLVFGAQKLKMSNCLVEILFDIDFCHFKIRFADLVIDISRLNLLLFVGRASQYFNRSIFTTDLHIRSLFFISTKRSTKNLILTSGTLKSKSFFVFCQKYKFWAVRCTKTKSHLWSSAKRKKTPKKPKSIPR